MSDAYLIESLKLVPALKNISPPVLNLRSFSSKLLEPIVNLPPLAISGLFPEPVNVNFCVTDWPEPDVLNTVLSTSMLSAFTVIPPPPAPIISNVLSEANVPPPVKPAPAVRLLLNGAFKAIESVKVVAKLALSFNAAEISFSVSNVAGAPSTSLVVTAVIAAST